MIINLDKKKKTKILLINYFSMLLNQQLLLYKHGRGYKTLDYLVLTSEFSNIFIAGQFYFAGRFTINTELLRSCIPFEENVHGLSACSDSAFCS